MIEEYVPQIAVVQRGARNHYIAPSALNQCGMLYKLYTDAYTQDGRWQTRLARALGRFFPDLDRILSLRKADIPERKIDAAWTLTILEILCRGWAKSGQKKAKLEAFLAQRQTRLACCQEILTADAVYGFSGSCPELFQTAKAHNQKTILEQASATVSVSNEIMLHEYERWPGWETGTPAISELYAEREKAELLLADLVIAPSEFVRKSLLAAGVDNSRVKVVPYAYVAPPLTEHPRRVSNQSELNVLFVGNVNLQKGIPYLLEAACKLRGENFNFRVVGPVWLEQKKLANYEGSVQFLGKLPHSQVRKQYEWADVFVFPTLCDGFGLVQLEAAAFGLPLIATENCGNVVREGKDGFLVAVRDSDSIALSLQKLKDNPELLLSMSVSVRKRSMHFSEDLYVDGLVEQIRGLFG